MNLRTSRPATLICLLGLALGACTPKDDSNNGGDDTGPDTSPPVDTSDFPDDPAPFDVQVSGAYEGTLTFDEPDCYYPTGSSNLRVFWRNADGAHAFFLLVELLGDFQGAGSYDGGNSDPRARLQEEAGGTGNTFASDSGLGDTVTFLVEQLEEDRAWGEFTISGMHDGQGGAITLSPSTLPIWCPVLEN
jgi:hypothetical protein